MLLLPPFVSKPSISPPISLFSQYDPSQFTPSPWNAESYFSSPRSSGILRRLVSSESINSDRPTAYPTLPDSPITPSRSTPTGRIRRLLSSECIALVYSPVPNLELHSAAASGNVGLVHYALTHGQPVNSVLHGVLPLHAACSGGSVSVVRMLIERGADVNAPRLPRRYSDNKKSSVPSVGTSGSTPLHFAAANGHAPIVQILLTCGAIPDKPDKNGLTPEDLAQANNHDDVIRVLRVWERLKAQEQNAEHDAGSSSGTRTGLDDHVALVDYPWSDRVASDRGQTSPSGSTSNLDVEAEVTAYGSVRSRKGKERAGSFASANSDQVGNVRKGFQTLWRRNRGSSDTHVEDRDAGTKPVPPRIEIPTPVTEDDSQHSPCDLQSPFSASISPGSVISNGEDTLVRVTSEASHNSSQHLTTIAESEIPQSGPSPNSQHPSSAHSSSRRSRPSILEKATHPGAAFRAAMRRDHEPKSDRSSNTSVGEISPRSPPSQSGSFFRGRLRSNDSGMTTTSSTSSGRHQGHHQPRKYMSKGSLMSLFRRGESPPSRSPSPPDRKESGRIIGNEELDEGIERFKRASLDMERESRANSSEFTETVDLPVSAPVTKTTFFPSSPTLPHLSRPLSNQSDNGDDRSPISATSSTSERPWNRPRQSSEVVSPSPLANEWAHDEDSDSPRSGIRRVQTEIIKPHLSPRRVTGSHSGPAISSMTTKPRSATLPSGFTGYQPQRGMSGPPPMTGLDWDDDVDLRKVASGVFRREGERMRLEAEAAEAGGVGAEEKHTEYGKSPEDVDEETDGDEQEFHDANTGPEDTEVDEPIAEENEIGVEDSEQVSADSERTESPRMNPSRLRGASIGSITTESSRIYTPPGSSLRISSLASEAGSFERPEDRKSFSSSRSIPHPVNLALDTRPRGKSVSSVSSATSGMAFSYMPPASSPATSVTPPSALSITLGGGFPPVPENEVAIQPQTTRTISSHAEARDLVKQNERDILHIAQLPPSLDSSRSLSAQLAAYGESHAIEREFAMAERRRGSSRFGSTDGSSENVSYFSADSGDSRSRSGRSDLSRRTPSSLSRPGEQAGQPRPRATSTPLIKVDAPKSSVPSINSIYDKRAAAYRERLQALTAVPPIPSGQSKPRPRAQTSSESWMNAGPISRQSSHLSSIVTNRPIDEIDKHPNISSPMPMPSSYLIPPRPQKKTSHGQSSIRPTHSTRQSSSSGHITPSLQHSISSSSRFPLPQPRRYTQSNLAPAPIADVLSTRFQGLPQPNASSSSSQQSPYISIFSSRYSGPNGGANGDIDSDEGEYEPRQLTVIENDWRGGHVVVDDSFKKGRKWGFKALPHLGRKSG